MQASTFEFYDIYPTQFPQPEKLNGDPSSQIQQVVMNTPFSTTSKQYQKMDFFYVEKEEKFLYKITSFNQAKNVDLFVKNTTGCFAIEEPTATLQIANDRTSFPLLKVNNSWSVETKRSTTAAAKGSAANIQTLPLGQENLILTSPTFHVTEETYLHLRPHIAVIGNFIDEDNAFTFQPIKDDMKHSGNSYNLPQNETGKFWFEESVKLDDGNQLTHFSQAYDAEIAGIEDIAIGTDEEKKIYYTKLFRFFACVFHLHLALHRPINVPPDKIVEALNLTNASIKTPPKNNTDTENAVKDICNEINSTTTHLAGSLVTITTTQTLIEVIFGALKEINILQRNESLVLLKLYVDNCRNPPENITIPDASTPALSKNSCLKSIVSAMDIIMRLPDNEAIFGKKRKFAIGGPNDQDLNFHQTLIKERPQMGQLFEYWKVNRKAPTLASQNVAYEFPLRGEKNLPNDNTYKPPSHPEGQTFKIIFTEKGNNYESDRDDIILVQDENIFYYYDELVKSHAIFCDEKLSIQHGRNPSIKLPSSNIYKNTIEVDETNMKLKIKTFHGKIDIGEVIFSLKGGSSPHGYGSGSGSSSPHGSGSGSSSPHSFHSVSL